MKQDLNEKIDRNIKEISSLKEKLQNKEVEIQKLKFDHKKEMTESMEKMKMDKKDEFNLFIEQHNQDLQAQGKNVEKIQIEKNE